MPIDRHTEAVDELDVQGILPFAERILPRASDLWVQASPDYKQRLQALFFPEGITPSESTDEKVVSLNFASWNQLDGWLWQVEALRRVA